MLIIKQFNTIIVSYSKGRAAGKVGRFLLTGYIKNESMHTQGRINPDKLWNRTT